MVLKRIFIHFFGKKKEILEKYLYFFGEKKSFFDTFLVKKPLPSWGFSPKFWLPFLENSFLQFFSSSVRNFRGYLSSWLSIVNVNHFGSLDSSKTSQTPFKLPGISTGFVCASCKGLQLKHITSIGVLLLTKIHWFSSEEAGE